MPFGTQQPQQGRQLGSRLTNGKMGMLEGLGLWSCLWSISDDPNNTTGSGSGWGFGVPMGGAPGLQHPQSRPNGAALTSFAQTIGGTQSSTSLDPS
jgi:hypothetical protein